MLPAHPFPGVGGERSETEGGGWMGRSAARVQKVQRGRFLRWTGLMAGGFLGLTAFQAEGGGGGSAASFIRPPIGGPPPPLRGPPPPNERWEASLKGVVLLPPQNGIEGLRATFFSSMLPAHPLPGGGWRAQRDGRGRLDGPLRGPGSEGSERKVLRMDGPGPKGS